MLDFLTCSHSRDENAFMGSQDEATHLDQLYLMLKHTGAFIFQNPTQGVTSLLSGDC